MSEISARDALEYATRDPFLKLYGVVVGSWVLLFVGSFLLGMFAALPRFIGVLVIIAGFGVFLSALVAILYKLLAENR